MNRRYNHINGTTTTTTTTTVAGNAITSAAQSLTRDEQKYQLQIQECHVKCTVLAEHLKDSLNCTTVAALLLEDDDDDSNNGDNQQFLEDLRKEVKLITKKHVRQVRDVNIFVQAVQTVAENCIQTQANANEESLDDDDAKLFVNYEELIHQKIVEIQAKEETQGLVIDVEDEHMYRDILKCLGEKRKRNDDDEELEMLSDDEQNVEDLEKKLKCPITTSLLEDAVRNKVCGHVYSRQGVMGMFRSRNYKCPMPGCSNRRMSQDQLENDLQIQEKVKRFKRRKEHHLQSQMDDDDDDDEYDVIE